MRATWPPEDAAWLKANAAGLPPLSPYRPGWLQPSPRKDTGRDTTKPWLTLREEPAWKDASMTALCLEWLRREFGGYGGHCE